ncbi:MAG: YfiR family protein [Gammaproteobacteria bacterium]
MLLLMSWPFGVEAIAAETARVERVKAAFVLNIARFVSWPAEALSERGGRLLLCLYRSNPLTEALATIQGEEVVGHRIEIGRIQSLADSGLCHMLLIDRNELAYYSSEAASLPERPMLTIADLTEADAGGQARPGILVALVRNGARIGFEIDLAKSRRAGLRMSSELLKLATIVGDESIP